MNKELDVVIGYIKTLEDFHELRHIKLTKERNGKSYRVYRLSYLDANNKEIDVRLELNQKKEKLSFGLWNDSSLQTVKYKHFLKA